MKEILLTVKITIDEENIANLYPNYYYNYESVEDFIHMLVTDIETPSEELDRPIDYLKEVGYKIDVLKRHEAKVYDLKPDESI